MRNMWKFRFPVPLRLWFAALGCAALLFSAPWAFAALQATPANSPSPGTVQGAPVASSAPAVLSEDLRPALHQVQRAVSQIDIDRWKLSRQWKRQMQEDANSIQNDLSTQLPALLQTAQSSPTMLGPQLSVMHNVDALYDVMVRLSMAASLSGGKDDTALLTDAMQQLEAARKATADRLLNASTQQDQQLLSLQKQTAQSHESKHAGAGASPHTIVVDNDGSGHARRRKTVRHIKPSSSGNAAPAASHPN